MPEAPEKAAERAGRRPWDEGPGGEAASESWLGLADDELLHRMETLDPEENADDRMIEIALEAAATLGG